MIKLDYGNISVNKVGATHGLNLEQVFKDSEGRIRDIVSQMYAEKDQAGGWKRWLNLGYDQALADELNAYAQSVKGRFSDMVILGIGGSSLGGYALLRALLHPYWNQLSDAQRQGFPRYYFVENVDGDQINPLMEMLDPQRTLFVVISKSGTTAETMSAFMIAKDWLERKLPPEKVKEHIVAITDAKTGVLRPVADKEQYQTFEVPDDVGGRFSVFCAVGLLPAVLCGVSLAEIQNGIRDLDKVLQNPDLQQNPAAQGALIQYSLYERDKRISVFMPYSFRLASVSDWYVQLWAESLGKKTDLQGNTVHVGPTPVRAVGVTDQHSQVQLFNEGPFDKVFTFVSVGKPAQDIQIPANQFSDIEDLNYLNGKPMSQLMQAEFDSTRASITANQRPNMTLHLPQVDAYHVAQLLYLLEVQTAIAGALMGIDPFDQPGVELAKKYTYALMGRKGYENLVAEARGEKSAIGV
ncbi:glucose-6-phosphate isomerase [Vampirovibrio sp.]|uniref:glucose-6-phosphate isomerase n=1 Tax=Vampirovibrio sp. TaxID=2717857 RepID=UPI003593A785